jgi:hypothetical protein
VTPTAMFVVSVMNERTAACRSWSWTVTMMRSAVLK